MERSTRGTRLAVTRLEARHLPSVALAADWLRAMQITADPTKPGYGAVLGRQDLGSQPGHPLESPVYGYTSDAYFSALGYRGLLKSDLWTPADLTRVELILKEHVRNLNGDYVRPNQWYVNQNGTTDGTRLSPPGTETTPTDADDSNAAMIADLAWQYVRRGGDPTWLRTDLVKQAFGHIAGVMTGLMQADGLTWAKATYDVKFLADNCEVFVGLQAFARLYRDVWNDSAASDFYYAKAEVVRKAVVDNFYDPATRLFRTSKDGVGAYVVFDPAGAYPSYLILTPAVYGVIDRGSAVATDQLDAVTTAFPSWPTDLLNLNAATARSALFGYAARVSGDPTRAQAQADRLSDYYFPTGTNPPAPAGPMSVNEAGWLMLNTNDTNRAPAATGRAVSVNAGASATFTLGGTDPNGDALTTFVSTPPAHGTLARVGGQWQYTPAVGYSGADSFRFRTDDGDLDSPTAGMVTIAVNGAPTGVTLTPAAVPENRPAGTAVGTLSATDPDAGDTFTYALVAGAGAADNGAFAVVGGGLVTAAAFDFEVRSNYSVRVRATDAGGLTFERTVTVSVTNVNEAPTQVSLSAATVAENRPVGTLVGTLTRTDPDAGDTPTYTLLADAGGRIRVVGARLEVAGPIDFEQTATLAVRVRVTDGGGLVFDKDLTLTVTNVNEPPTAPGVTAAVGEDAALTVPAAAGLATGATDPDGDTLVVTRVNGLAVVGQTVTLPSGAQLAVAADGSFVYDPRPTARFQALTPGQTDADTFTFTLSDGNGVTVTATATVTVTGVNDPPTAGTDTPTIAEDAAATTVNVLGNDSFAPDTGETLVVSAVGQPSHGVTTLVGGEVKYAPAADYNGPDSFTYTLSDGNGGTVTGTVNVTVSPVNDPPVTGPDTLTVAEDAAATVVNVLGNDGFAPDVGETLVVASVTQPANGVATLAGGVVKYAPAADFNGTDTFTYLVSDGNGGTTTGTVTVTVTPVNDPPTAAPDALRVPPTAPATLAVLANDSSAPDAGESLSVTAVTPPTAGGTVAIAPGGGGVVFTPAAGFIGTATFTYTASDGNGGTATATVTVAVEASGLGPVRPVAVGGGADGSVRLVTAAGTTLTLSPFGNTGTPTRTASADVDGDGTADVVAVTGPGTALRLAVLSGKDGRVLLAPFDPFGGNFLGGGYAAAADLDADGRAEFAVTPDEGGGPRVSIYTLNANGTTAVRANFFGIDDANFRGGARAAIGDVNGDGVPDVVVAAGFGGGPRTAIFTGQSVLAGAPQRLVGDFFAFPGPDATTLRNGSFVAAGDVTGDGFADLIFGGGPGGAPRVFVLSGALVSAGNVAGAQASPVANFFVGGDLNDRGGARVGVTNADGDAKADVAVGSGAGRPARVRLYLGKDFGGGGEPAFTDLDALGGAVLTDGVYVG